MYLHWYYDSLVTADAYVSIPAILWWQAFLCPYEIQDWNYEDMYEI